MLKMFQQNRLTLQLLPLAVMSLMSHNSFTDSYLHLCLFYNVRKGVPEIKYRDRKISFINYNKCMGKSPRKGRPGWIPAEVDKSLRMLVNSHTLRLQYVLISK